MKFLVITITHLAMSCIGNTSYAMFDTISRYKLSSDSV